MLVCATLLVGCSSDNKESREMLKKSIINLRQEPPQLNSILAYDSVSFNVINHVFEGLTRIDKNQNVIPGVAKGWDISEDKLTYTFYIRNSKWSDGSKISAKDFEFAIKEVLNPKNLSQHASVMYMIKNAKEYNQGNCLREDVGIIAKSDDILEITLEYPCSYFLYLTSCANFMPVKQEFYERQRGQYAKTEQNMIFNGAWIIDEWNHGQKMILRKNLNYWNSNNIRLNEIECLMVKDEQLEYSLFKDGNLDIMNVVGDNLNQAINDGYTVKKYLDGVTVYLEFNINSNILKDKNIRDSITYVIDKDELCDDILKNGDIKATTLINPVVKSGSEIDIQKHKITNKKQRLNLAKSLFEAGIRQLGISNLNDVSITMLAQDGEISTKEALYYKECIEKNLNVSVNLITLPFGEQLQKYRNGDFDIAIVKLAPDYNSPITYLDMLSSNNSLTYKNEIYDELLTMAQCETNDKKRVEMIKEMENIISRDVPIYPLYYRQMYYVVNTKIKDIVKGAFRDLDMYYAHY